MKINKNNWLIVIVFVLGISIAKGQNTPTKQDTVRIPGLGGSMGIPITKAEFEKKISKYLTLMSNWTDFTANDYIEMVRLYNTIAVFGTPKNDFYRMYYEIFLVMYNKPASNKLDAKLSKGMEMYSQKYNVWMGSAPMCNDNSIFKLDTAK